MHQSPSNRPVAVENKYKDWDEAGAKNCIQINNINPIIHNSFCSTSEGPPRPSLHAAAATAFGIFLVAFCRGLDSVRIGIGTDLEWAQFVTVYLSTTSAVSPLLCPSRSWEEASRYHESEPRYLQVRRSRSHPIGIYSLILISSHTLSSILSRLPTSYPHTLIPCQL